MTYDELKARFYNELWPLNRSGDEEVTLKYVEIIINKGYTINNAIIDLDFLVSRYKEYLLKWNYEHGTKSKEDQKYMRKEDALLSIYNFLYMQKYRESFEIKRTPRDEYLFRGLSLKQLSDIINEWEKKVYVKRTKLHF